MQGWEQFFNEIQRFFVSQPAPAAATDFWQPMRASSVKHFCAPTRHAAIELQRHIYVMEGSKAHRLAETVRLALESHAQFYFIYKLRYDEYEKYRLLKKAAGRKNPKTKLAEDVHDYLLREALYKAQEKLRKHLVKMIPLFSDAVMQAEVMLYIEDKVIWELQHPDEIYKKHFVSLTTLYGKHVQDTSVDMPHFNNTIGKVSIIKHPLITLGYAIDACRKILFDYPARGVCWLTHKISLGNTVVNVILSVVLAGWLVILDIFCFGLAKVFAGDPFTWHDDSSSSQSMLANQKIKNKNPLRSLREAGTHIPIKKRSTSSIPRIAKHK